MNSTFLQKVFCDISLEQRPQLWQDDTDSEEKNVERIEFLASLPQTEFLAQTDASRSSTRKNGVLAKALREKGNKSYGAGDNIEAMHHYNQALRFAHPEEQGMVLANRSALWAQLGEAGLVMEDVDLALEAGYPGELAYKLLERRARARQVLGRREQAMGDAKAALEGLKLAKLAPEKIEAKRGELEKLVQDLAKKQEVTEEVTSSLREEPQLPGENPKFPNFSDAVRIKYEEGRGRFAVAGRDIKAGELIARERPFVSLLDREHTKSHCWHCLTCTKVGHRSLCCTGTWSPLPSTVLHCIVLLCRVPCPVHPALESSTAAEVAGDLDCTEQTKV